MCVCEIIALWKLATGARNVWTFAAAVLNLTPLYYLKVMIWGPTIGNI